MRPRFLQLYIYDTEHELQDRMLENTQLHETLVFELQQLLHQYNPFLHVFHQLAQRSDVAAIIVGDDVETMIRGQILRCKLMLVAYEGFGNSLAITIHYNILFFFHLKLMDGILILEVKVAAKYHAEHIRAIWSRWVQTRQKKLRAELYQGLQDALHIGETNAENVGRKRTILPSSFIGSHRDMTQRYEDGMAIVLKEGKPDIFLTMTCNPSWTEITSELNPVQTPQNRLDLITKIFRAKFKQLKEDVITKGVLEKVKSYIYVTKFQKRGLSHVHMLLILENNDKLIDSEYCDSLRRFDTPVPINQNITVDNRWVVPYNPWLLLKYDCHINVEICSIIKSIKYLYKYCYKGQDRVAMEVHNVKRLQIHLPNQHQVSFYDYQTIPEILNDDYFSRIMLTEFFALNREENQQSREPISWDDLLTVNEVQYSSFKQYAQH
ncbi:uncharacterized protein LOC130966917 [Arachis stenosperma]|uniref:uncharacterized protein LOC130966917 n=1 Tax=Arachis stenosperma TaxID=217475 RepID=UPI0025AC9CDE|nr:uncharacterized protein LOC130966917 [Arachis stenosperma]